MQKAEMNYTTQTLVFESKTGTYGVQQIARELDMTALNVAYYGNALRVAKDIACVSSEDRSVLDRWATGLENSTDHLRLQEIAMKIRSSI